MRKLYSCFLFGLTLILISLIAAQNVAGQSKVIIPGTFQSELGCSGDWDAACDNTALTYDPSTGLWVGTFNIPAGCHQYKVAIDGSWSINYGENGLQGGANIPLYVPTSTMITFTYYPSTNLVTTSPIASGFNSNCLPQVVLAGSMQTELGCATDWDASCTSTALSYNSGSGLFEGDFNVPPGCYEYRVVLDNDWVNNFGRYGSVSDPNYILSVPSATTLVHFAYNPVNHTVTSPYNSYVCLPGAVTLAGSFQTALGCPADWQADCSMSSLLFNPASGLFEGNFTLPAGCYEYRVVLNNNWATNYGRWGSPEGPNYILSLPASGATVHFSFDPNSNLVSSMYNSNVCQPGTVVIAGSFQSELGCTGDWQPDCDNSRLEYDPSSGNWTDTFFIPAGKWEYKITINNSWAENYGLYGLPGGENIPLEVCIPSQVVFSYNHEYHYVNVQFITNGICLTKFYDANINGYPDYGEQPMKGVSFTLTGNGISQVQTADSNGKAAFPGLANGNYLLKETIPLGYFSSMQDSQMVFVFGGVSSVYFGNVCLGAGGARGRGYWSSTDGETALNNSGLMQNALAELRNLNLRNADGSNFDPSTYAQFKKWLQGANAKNMTNMLSAQLATLYLNQLIGFIKYESIVYTPGCGLWADGKFMYTNTLIDYTNYYLMFVDNSTGNEPNRPYLECLKNALDNANNDLTFIQPGPCSTPAITIDRRNADESNSVISSITEARVWPSPSNSYFTLRPANSGNGEVVLLKAFNVNGEQVYTARGASNKDYRFGDKFIPGMYLVEVIQGNTRATFRLVKQ